jgi:hypothetical protein
MSLEGTMRDDEGAMITSADAPPRPIQDDLPSQRQERSDLLLVALAASAFLALTLPGLGSRSLWLDEAFTVANSQTPLAEIGRINGGQMLGYYALMRPLTSSVQSEFWLRLPSVVAFLVAIPVFHLVARRVLQGPAVAIATVAFACNPITLAYAREARPYSLAVLCACLSWWAILIVIEPGERPRGRVLGAWVVVTAVATYLHFLFLILVPAQLMAVALSRRGWRGLREFAFPLAALVISILPLAALAATPSEHAPQWVPELGGLLIAQTIGFVLGAGFGVAGLLTALGLWAALVRGVRPARTTIHPTDRWRELTPVLWLVVPFASLLALSLAVPSLVERYLLVALPASILLIGKAVATLQSRWPRAPVVVAVLLLLSYAPSWDAQTHHEDWRYITDEIAALPADAAVVFVTERLRTPVDVYLDWDARPPAARPLAPHDAWGTPKRTYDGRVTPEDLRDVPGDVWVIHRAANGDETIDVLRLLETAGFSRIDVRSDLHGKLALTQHRRIERAGAER